MLFVVVNKDNGFVCLFTTSYDMILACYSYSYSCSYSCSYSYGCVNNKNNKLRTSFFCF